LCEPLLLLHRLVGQHIRQAHDRCPGPAKDGLGSHAFNLRPPPRGRVAIIADGHADDEVATDAQQRYDSGEG
jgi:hypothetical protein